jgi:hypothetical protein
MGAPRCVVCAVGLALGSLGGLAVALGESHVVKVHCDRANPAQVRCDVSEQHGIRGPWEHKEVVLDGPQKLELAKDDTRHGTLSAIHATDGQGRTRTVAYSTRASLDKMYRQLDEYLGDPDSPPVDARAAGHFTAIFGLLGFLACAVGAMWTGFPGLFAPRAR